MSQFTDEGANSTLSNITKSFAERQKIVLTQPFNAMEQKPAKAGNGKFKELIKTITPELSAILVEKGVIDENERSQLQAEIENGVDSEIINRIDAWFSTAWGSLVLDLVKTVGLGFLVRKKELDKQNVTNTTTTIKSE